MNSTKPSLKETLDTTEAVHTHLHTSEHEHEETGRHHALHRKVKAHVHKHVHKLRQRPDHHKRVIAFGTAFVCTAIVFTLWYYLSLPQILSAYRTNVEENKRLNRTPNIIQGFNDMYDAKVNRANATDAIEAGE